MILGKKLGMTQIFGETGDVIPVTVVEAGPCGGGQRKRKDTDGYEAVQVGFEEILERKTTKPYRTHFTKKNLKPFRFLREFRVPMESPLDVGQTVTVEAFQVGD